MRRALWLLWMIGAGSAAMASVGFVDLDAKSSEIRFSAVVVPFTGKSGPEFKLRVCTNPIDQWKNGCADSGLESSPMTYREWWNRLRQYLAIDAAALADTERQERERVIVWSRDLIRERLESGAVGANVKEKAENVLNEMLDAVDPAIEKAGQEDRKTTFDSVVGWFRKNEFSEAQGSAPKASILAAAEKAHYFSGLAPFSAWIARSVCRCDRVVGEGALDVPQCVLRKGARTLAWSKASLSACSNRVSCTARDWFSDDTNRTRADFTKLLVAECGGFYSVGAPLSEQGNFGKNMGRE